MSENLELDDAKIGVEAFINKTKPVWKKWNKFLFLKKIYFL